MEHRRFGRTGLQVPAITFGGGWVGGVLIHRGPDEATAALDLAWDAGIDWIDTAALYGNGVSETVIGQWLNGRGTDERPGISTKFRIDPAAPDLKGQMLRSVEESLKRLGLGRVSVIIQHNALDQNYPAARALEMADTMEELREQALCDHIGMTALGDPEHLHEVVGSGRYDIAQVYYNMLNATAWNERESWNSTDFNGLLRQCADQDMGVMGIRIFAGGHLATPVRHGREIPVTVASDDAAEERRARAVWEVLGPSDGTRAQAAIRFGLACPAVSTVVVGLGELDHLREAIEGAAMGPLPAERMEAIATAWDGPAFTG